MFDNTKELLQELSLLERECAEVSKENATLKEQLNALKEKSQHAQRVKRVRLIDAVVVPKEEYYTVIGLLVSAIVTDHGDEEAFKFLLHHFIDVMESENLMKEYMKWQENEFEKMDKVIDEVEE